VADLTDREFIGYCRIHCTTERALFVGAHINRILDLAGRPEGYNQDRIPDGSWHSLSEGWMLPLCDLADARAKQQE
jgi:hypothetical protein